MPRSPGSAVVERRFDVEVEGRRVPGVLWLPRERGARLPLVLIGHGGSQHKLSDGPRELASRLVTEHGLAAAAIDGPVHGERREDGGTDAGAVFTDARASWEDPGLLASTAADWRGALDAVEAMDDLDVGPVGWWGLSMGTLYGIPVIAADDRIEAAVLGLWGSVGTTAATWEALSGAAASVTCPLLFLAQLEDQLFAPEGVLELFTALGSRDKRMHLNVGSHGEVPPDEHEATITFLADRLVGGGQA